MDERERETIESAAAVGFIWLMAVRLAVVDTDDTSSAREREGDGIVGSRNDAALCVLHRNGNVSNVIWRGAQALPIVDKH